MMPSPRSQAATLRVGAARNPPHEEKFMYLAKRLPSYVLALCLLAMPLAVRAANHDDDRDDHHIRRVLLISVDGLHALDLTNYVAAHPQSTLAQLSSHAKTYTNASASQ